MRKLLVFTLAATMALFVGGAAYANYCARDYVPAATLLVPYIEVDMEAGNVNPLGATTIFSIINVSDQAQIVHLVAWDAISDAVWDFDIVLSGYDVWTINFRDFLLGTWGPFDTDEGIALVPDDPFEWGPDGRDTYNGGATNGILDTPEDRNVFNTDAACDPNPPYGDVTPDIVGGLDDPLFARTHNGCGTRQVRSDLLPDWLATDDADPLRFYFTADVVAYCSQLFPQDSGYFTTLIRHDNVLVGDIIYLNAGAGFSEAMGAVSIESDLDEFITKNFYNNVADAREPLGTAFAFRYIDDADGSIYGIPATSSVIVWKDAADFLAAPNLNKVDDCGHYLYYAWDNDEQSKSRSQGGGPSGGRINDVDPNEFPYETQKVAMSQDYFDIFEMGWMLLVFDDSHPLAPWTDPTTPEVTTGPDQAWVAVTFEFGDFSAGFEAALLANQNCFGDEVLPQLNTYNGAVDDNTLRGLGVATD